MNLEVGLSSVHPSDETVAWADALIAALRETLKLYHAVKLCSDSCSIETGRYQMCVVFAAKF